MCVVWCTQQSRSAAAELAAANEKAERERKAAAAELAAVQERLKIETERVKVVVALC
jgi:hypothetical protein